MKSPFGQYVKRKRIEAGLSLRDVADGLKLSHVFVGEIERGTTGPLKKERWPDLVAVIKHGAEEAGHQVDISLESLEEVAATTRPIQLNLQRAPKEYQTLGIALARRIEKRDLPPGDLDEILRLLRGGA